MKECWNQIGVWSKQAAKCEKLLDVVHCRNCEVFAKAGKRAIEKAASKEYIDQWTKVYAQVSAKQIKKQYSVVIFRLGMEWFCLPTEFFKGIENLNVIHSIPRVYNQILIGLVNIKGAVKLCFAVDKLLELDPGNTAGENTIGIYKRLLVLEHQNQNYVFPVDEVGGVERIDETALETLPSNLNEKHANLVKGVMKSQSGRVAVLNAPRLFGALEDAVSG